MTPDELLDAFEAAVTGRRRSVLAECCTLDVHYEDPMSGPPLQGVDALGDHLARLWAAFPDVRVERAGVRLHDGRSVAAPVQITGTHAGETGELPPTGKVLAVHAVIWCELDAAGARISRVRVFYDLWDAAVQLGVLPKSGGIGERALLILRGFGLRG